MTCSTGTNQHTWRLSTGKKGWGIHWLASLAIPFDQKTECTVSFLEESTHCYQVGPVLTNCWPFALPSSWIHTSSASSDPNSQHSQDNWKTIPKVTLNQAFSGPIPRSQKQTKSWNRQLFSRSQKMKKLPSTYSLPLFGLPTPGVGGGEIFLLTKTSRSLAIDYKADWRSLISIYFPLPPWTLLQTLSSLSITPLSQQVKHKPGNSLYQFSKAWWH